MTSPPALAARLALGVAATLLASTISLSPALARAQRDTVSLAEEAWQRGEHDRAARLCREALASGLHEPAAAGRLYRVLGLATASLGDEDAAREAFTRYLAIEPEARLDRGLSAEVRSPFMEARGFWSSAQHRLGIEVTLDAAAQQVRAEAHDAARMGARARLRLRDATGAWRETVLPVDQRIDVPLAGLVDEGASVLEYSVTMLDEHGNRIYRRGSDTEPAQLELPEPITPRATGDEGPPLRRASTPRADATGFHVAGTVLAIGALGASVAAVVAHAERERLAGEWNDDSRCLVEGLTRAEQCAPLDSGRAGAEMAAIALYAVGGALAVGAAVVLALAPGGGGEPAVTSGSAWCSDGPGELGIACGARF